MQHGEMTTQAVASGKHNEASGPSTRLRGRWLVAGRLLWVILFVLSLVWFGMELALQFAAIQHPCSGALCIISQAESETLRQLGISLNAFAVYFAGIPLVNVLAGSIVALFLFWRRSDDWLALVVALFLVAYPISNVALLPGPQAAPEFAAAIQVPNVLIYYSVFLIFPNGRFVPRWTWLLLVAWAAFIWTGAIASALGSQLPLWGALAYPILYLSALGAQIYRYRRISTARQRQQTKWVILGFAVALVANILYWIVLPVVVLPAVVPSFQSHVALYSVAAYPVYELATVALPVSFAIAIQRHQLFDVDVLIRRTLVYGSLTVLLAAVYFGSVLGMQQVVRALTGQSGQNPPVIVLSTLLIAALFAPLRRGLQAAVDRRFYRAKYDASRTLESFAATLRSEVDLADLSEHLVGVVQETMQPTSVSLWLRESGKTSRAIDPSAATEEGRADAVT